MADDTIYGAKLVATVIKPGRFNLGIQAFASEKGITIPRSSAKPPPILVAYRSTVTVDANGWVRLKLLDHSGKYRGYQMLVQLVPIAEG